MRKCKFKVYKEFKEKQEVGKGTYKYGEYVSMDGYFHQWGLDKDEEGSYSVGICEDSQGKIYTPYPAQIKLLEGQNASDIICPYCGYKRQPDVDDYESCEDEMCPKCGKVFSCVVENNPTFTMSRKD